jgi:hypothetical protein
MQLILLLAQAWPLGILLEESIVSVWKLSKLDAFVYTKTQRVISRLFCGHFLNGTISLQDITLSPLGLRRDFGQVGNIGLNGA